MVVNHSKLKAIMKQHSEKKIKRTRLVVENKEKQKQNKDKQNGRTN